ncbi:histidine N-alpha-methyltransferase-like [Dreissena polymorpha]|uniref:histidine N-alpha-methyltransferase-like n=1 Tax=Dreissena polymorpha TaxID=45954 RepID=UPI002263C92B|nr:histidine N-alpha-methyltransferase-like [Dreissena polymorpha]
MDVRRVIAEGLQMRPPRLPVWFRYDMHGSLYNDKCLKNQHYYFYRSEVAVLSSNIQEIVDTVTTPVILVEMGSGNSEKTRSVIDVLLKKQTTLTYVPIDISADFLRETSESLSRDYAGCLDVKPVPGDYNVGIDKIRTIPGRKLIIWMGGGFQNQAYQTQITRLQSLAQFMTGDDRLLVAVDVTQEPKVVERAYRDPDAGLGLSLTFDADDKLRLHEGEYVSCKYTEAQLRHIAKRGGLSLSRIWTDADKHVALCCFSKGAGKQTS